MENGWQQDSQTLGRELKSHRRKNLTLSKLNEFGESQFPHLKTGDDGMTGEA